MKKYIIIGGAGFIGSALADKLSSDKNKVVVIDNFSANPAKKNNPKVKNYKTDVESEKEILRILKKEKPDFVFHLAGAINLRKNIADPLFSKDLNFLQRTKIVLNACSENNVKKIIFISSGGAINENAFKIPTPENYLSCPRSLYGMANLMIEKYIKLYCQNYNLNFVIARLCNVYGPGQWKSGIIPSLIISILKKQRPIIFGKGSQTRDFIYIDDAVLALIVLAKKGKNEIYNIGTGKEVNLNKIFKLVKDLLDSKINAKYQKAKNLEVQRSALDIGKIKKELGWSPIVSIQEGIRKTINYYDKK